MSNFSFGSTNSGQQQQQQPSIPSFSFTGASATPAAPAPAPSFSFGAPAAPAAGATAAGGSLFGAQPQQSAGQTGGGFSFGAKPVQPPAAGGGLFGQSTNTSQPTGGLFGQSQSQPAAGGGLFGQAQQQQQQQGQTPGLFGQPQQQQQPGGGLFGQSSQSQNQPSGGLFGQSQNQPASNPLFGGLQQSQNQNQQQQQAGSSSSGAQGGINKSSKFSELPADHQKRIEEMDAWIKQQKAAGQGISRDDLGKAIWRTTTDIKSCTEESSALTQSLQNTGQALQTLQARFVVEEEDVRRLAEIWETYKAVDGRPGQLRVAGHKEWPGEFFGRVSRGLEERVARYRVTIAQLNRVVVGLTNESETPSPHAIAQTIHNHQNALITLAAQLESLQLRMNSLKGVYATEYRDRTGSMRDPFDIAREEKGIAPVRA